jgi:hypothetical protein
MSGHRGKTSGSLAFSYPEPFLRAVNGARRGALAKSISTWHLIGYNEGYCSNTGYILLPCFHGIRFWIWPEPLVAPRVRRALGTRMTPTISGCWQSCDRPVPGPFPAFPMTKREKPWERGWGNWIFPAVIVHADKEPEPLNLGVPVVNFPRAS